jgi:hypothetical protein
MLNLTVRKAIAMLEKVKAVHSANCARSDLQAFWRDGEELQ